MPSSTTKITTKDASTIADGATGTTFASDWNGYDQHHPVGSFGSNAYRARSLINIPISFTGWSSVTSASLVLTTSTPTHGAWGSNSSKTLNVARSLVPWTEDAGAENSWTKYTSNTYNGYQYHNTLGTDYDTVVSLTGISATRPSTVTVNVTSIVQAWFNDWKNGISSNNGFLLYNGTETSDSHYMEFYSREFGTSGSRPQLNITYETNTAPTAPTINGPTGGSRQDGGFTLSFTKNDVDTADYISAYQVQVSTSTGFTTNVIDDTVTGVSGNLSTIYKSYSGASGLTPLTTYYWRARTADSSGAWGPFSTSTNAFKVNTSPTTPYGASPTGGSIVSTFTPVFTATSSDTDSGDTVSYVNVSLYKSSDGSLVWNSGDVSATNGAFAVTSGVTLSASTGYYWTSYTKDSFGYSSPVSSANQFTTFTGSVSLTTPNDDTNTGWVKTLNPVLSISTSSNMTKYNISVFDTSGVLYYTTGDVTVSATSSVSYTYTTPATALQWNSRYFWSATCTIGGTPVTSAQAMFHTNSKPIAVAVSPSDGAALTTLDPSFTIQFSDADLSYGLADSPTSLVVEVSKVSNSDVMYTITKSSGLSVSSNTVNKATAGVSVVAGPGTATLVANTQYRYRAYYKDNAGVSGNNTGDWSSYRTFKPTVSPTVASVAPVASDLTSGAINKPTATVQYTYTGSGSKAQSQKRLVVKNATSSAVLYDTGFITAIAASGTTVSTTIPSGYIPESTSVKFEVVAKDSDLLESSTVASTNYSTSWTGPADITGVSATAENGSIIVRWDSSTESNFMEYEIYRRKYGENDWETINYVSNKSDTSYIDFTSAIGITYEYRMTQYADYGSGLILESNPDSAIVITCSASDDNWFIVPNGRYDLSVELYAQSESRSNPFQEEIFEPFGRDRKVVVRTARYGAEGSFEAFIPADEVSDKVSKLNIALSLNDYVYLKDPFGAVYKVYLGAPEFSYQPGGSMVASINYVEVN
jgi:hypothetical protein